MVETARRHATAKRGRSPWSLGLRAWLRVGWRALKKSRTDHLSVVAGGCAFFSVLALFPAITALVALYGLVADPALVSAHIETLRGTIPSEALSFFQDQIDRLLDRSSFSLSFSLAATPLLAVWSAGKASRAVIKALNIPYEEGKTHGIVSLHLLSMAVTVAGLLGGVAVLVAISLVTAVLHRLDFEGTSLVLIAVVKWPTLMLALAAALSALYRIAPNRDEPAHVLVTPGAVIATVFLVVGSGAFSLYIAYFGNLSDIYGSFGALIILLLWLYASFLVVLIGAEINAEAEKELKRAGGMS